MNENGLIQNVIDQIKEAQLKLGYAEETIYLYFPLESLNSILQTDYKEEEGLLEALRQAPAFSGSTLGKLSFCLHLKRIEIRIPPQGARYVRECVPDPPFLKELIQIFSQSHALTIEEIKACFGKFGDGYVCEEMPSGSEFDYVLYFEDANIDAYRYCVKMEMGHAVYHRFTPADYERLDV